MTEHTDTVVADTRRWLERAVIGLNLCPFAKSVHVKGQVHYAVSAATDGRGLRDDLLRELRDLAAINPEVRDTTLLVVPDASLTSSISTTFWARPTPRWKNSTSKASCRSRRSIRASCLPARLMTISPTAPTAHRTRRCT